MIKLTVFNMSDFLQTVNGCIGAVNVVSSSGKKENINKQNDLQRDLERKYSENKNSLRLVLDIPNGKDYLNMVYFTIGDC